MESIEEKRRHSSILVPYSYYKCIIPDYFLYVPLHWHSEFEINIIISGTGDFKCGTSLIKAKPGDIIIIRPNMIHSIYPNDSKLIYDTVVFDQSMLGSLDDRSGSELIRPLILGYDEIDLPISIAYPGYNKIRKSLSCIISCSAENNTKSDLILKSELLKLFWLLIENGCTHHLCKRNIVGNDSIRRVLEYIKESFNENITIEQLADIAHLSKSCFMSKFKHAAGMGAIEYINRLRIKSVCEMLADTDMTASEAAFKSGFNNISNFNRIFKKTMGCTPLEYRKTLR